MKNASIDATIFNDAFNPSIWKNSEKIELLKLNIAKIESVVEKYLTRITDDFPQLTDHSLAHSKMLWNYANIIVGRKKFINPIEAFVLHIAFLIHDAGMCYSILDNKEKIKKDPFYTDFITFYGDSQETISEALFFTIRQRHGDFALKVAINKLGDGDYLIQDVSLREELGQIIGKIAKSHTCNTNYIEREFGAKYCNPNFPTDWSIDCQKLSFILRVSDAAHIDNLRTPKTLKMISEIKGDSREHWTFQKKLGFPVKSDDNLLIYSSNTPFSPNEQKAWWFCLDALQTLDKEIRTANEYFAVKQQIGFAVIGVKSINDTLELGEKYIRTTQWKSIDTKIKVTNPVHIASELGGVKLYGNINIALRELIQNSIDAINLYRFHTKQINNNVGEIKLSIEKDDNEYFLVVSDNGIGMSQTLMTNELLDFGGSYWKSNTFKYEFSGIKSQGFESIGKFGIGFFSVFMLGQFVTVTSWKFGEGIENMKTLDFYDGLYSNPILREPSIAEKQSVIDRGTSIKIKLSKNPYERGGLIGDSTFQENLLYSLTKLFVLSPNVKITITELDGTINSIYPKCIDSMPFDKLIDYFSVPKKNQSQLGAFNFLKGLNLDLIEVSDETQLYGRLLVLPTINSTMINSTGFILSNGIKVCELGNFAGYIMTDEVITIKRDVPSKPVPFNALKTWAVKQKEMIERANLQNIYNNIYYGLLVAFRLYDETLPIAIVKNNNNYSYVTIDEFRIFLKNNSKCIFFQENTTSITVELNIGGFIHMATIFNVAQIIKDEDVEHLLQYRKLIESIMSEEWGEYELVVDNFIESGDFYNMPYFRMETYSKIDN